MVEEGMDERSKVLGGERGRKRNGKRKLEVIEEEVGERRGD